VDQRPVVRVQLSPRRIRSVAVLISALSLLLLLATYLGHTFAPDQPWRIRYLALQVDLGRENNAAAWYASMLLLTVALAMAACFVLDLRTAADRRGRVLALGWLAIAALFAGLSLDELGSLHERINTVRMIEDMKNPLRIGVAGWVGILAIPALLVCGLVVAFGWLRLRQSRSAFVLMCAGLLMFATVPLQEAIELANWSASEQRGAGPLLLEEGTELFASLCLLLAALQFAYMRASPGDATERVVSFKPGVGVLIGLQAGVALAMAFVQFALPGIMDLQDTRGVTLNWFPAAMAFVIALSAAHAAIDAKARSGEPASGVWWLLALLHLALSVDHASAHRFTQELVSSTPELRWTLDAALAGLVVAGATLLALRARGFVSQGAVAGWAGLLLLATLLPAERAWLAFVAYALLLPVLIVMPRTQPVRMHERAHEAATP
jgi:hypothetical protein